MFFSSSDEDEEEPELCVLVLAFFPFFCSPSESELSDDDEDEDDDEEEDEDDEDELLLSVFPSVFLSVFAGFPFTSPLALSSSPRCRPPFSARASPAAPRLSWDGARVE